MGSRSLRNYRRAERERCSLAPCDLTALRAAADAMAAEAIAEIPDDAWTQPPCEGEGATADLMAKMAEVAALIGKRHTIEPEPVEVMASDWRVMVATYGEAKTRAALDSTARQVRAPGWYVVGMGDDGPRSEP